MQFGRSVFLLKFYLKRLLVVCSAVVAEHFYAAVKRKPVFPVRKKRYMRVALPVLPEVCAFMRKLVCVTRTVGVNARVIIKKVVGVCRKTDNGQRVIFVDDVTQRHHRRRQFSFFVSHRLDNGSLVQRQFAEVLRACICRLGAVGRIVNRRVAESGQRDFDVRYIVVNALRRVGKGC